MAAQRLSNGKTRQPGAVALVRVPLIAQTLKLIFGDGRKPTTEAVAILVGAQLNDVGDAIVVGVKQWTGWT